MKRVILTSVFFILSTFVVLKAQSPIQNGEKFLNFGFGTGLYIGLDYGVHPDISVGAQVDFDLTSNNRGIGLTARGDYHFNNLLGIQPKWDLYAGLNLGFWNGPWLASQVGARYFWNDKWGVNFEGGFGYGSGGRLGLTMKF